MQIEEENPAKPNPTREKNIQIHRKAQELCETAYSFADKKL